MITILDVENGGRALWRSRPGRAYQATLPPAFNGRGVFANDSGAIYGLNRETGALQWKYELRVALSARCRRTNSTSTSKTWRLRLYRGAPARTEKARSGDPESDPFSRGRDDAI